MSDRSSTRSPSACSGALGLEVALTALSTVRSGFGQRSALSIKAHRVVSRRMAIAVGVENAVVMGGGATDGTSSWFAVASRVFPVAAGADGGAPPGSMALAVSAGVGNGRFRRSQ